MSKAVTITAANFDAVVSDNEIVVIDFWAPWCQPCLAFAPIFEQVAAEHPDITFGKVNTEEAQELAAEFSIRSIPTLMIFRRKILLFNEAGTLPAKALKDLIEQAKALDMEKVLADLQEKN